MRPAIRLRRAERRRGSGMLIRLPATRCLNLFLHFVIAVHLGSNGAGTRVREEVTCKQALTQLLQALFAKVTYTEQVFLIHRKHLANLCDVTALETVVGTHREIKVLNRSLINLRGYGKLLKGGFSGSARAVR